MLPDIDRLGISRLRAHGIRVKSQQIHGELCDSCRAYETNPPLQENEIRYFRFIMAMRSMIQPMLMMHNICGMVYDEDAVNEDVMLAMGHMFSIARKRQQRRERQAWIRQLWTKFWPFSTKPAEEPASET